MTYLGLDISTYVGVAAVAGPNVYTRLLHLPLHKGIGRVAALGKGLLSFLEEIPEGPVVACIESYASPHRATLVKLVEIGTSIRLALHQRKVQWYDVPPSVLKLYATGKGNATKPEIAKSVLERWGFSSRSDDVNDAYVLARMAEVIGTTDVLPTQWKGVKRHEHC